MNYNFLKYVDTKMPFESHFCFPVTVFFIVIITIFIDDLTKTEKKNV